MDRILVRSEDTRCHRGFRLLDMSEKMVCVKQCAFQYAADQATIYLRSYTIIDMYISISSADAEVYSSREIDYYQQFFRAKRRNSEPSFWTSRGESGKEAASLPLPPLRTGLDGFHHPAQAVCKLCRGQNR